MLQGKDRGVRELSSWPLVYSKIPIFRIVIFSLRRSAQAKENLGSPHPQRFQLEGYFHPARCQEAFESAAGRSADPSLVRDDKGRVAAQVGVVSGWLDRSLTCLNRRTP